MIRRPPRSTLFPYRRSSDLHGNTTSLIDISPYKFDGPGGSGAPPHVHTVPMPDRRSEEHTSELQSQSNLVCRLLLEKKNWPSGVIEILEDILANQFLTISDI